MTIGELQNKLAKITLKYTTIEYLMSLPKDIFNRESIDSQIKVLYEEINKLRSEEV